MKTWARAAGLTLLLTLVVGCARSTPEEELVERAFEALQDGDWDTFYGTTITSADIMMQQNEIGPFQAQQSYLGSSVRPRERDAQRAQFDRAQDVGVVGANLRTAHFVALGTDVRRYDYELLTGGSIPVTSYSLRVHVDGNQLEIDEPRFVVVEWQERPRLLALDFERDAHTRGDPHSPSNPRPASNAPASGRRRDAWISVGGHDAPITPPRAEAHRPGDAPAASNVDGLKEALHGIASHPGATDKMVSRVPGYGVLFRVQPVRRQRQRNR